MKQYPASTNFGFASYKDGSFELIAENLETGKEIMLKGPPGSIGPGDLEKIDQVLPTCVFVKAVNLK